MSVPDAGQLAESLEDATKTITQSQPSLFSVTGKLVTLPSCEAIIVGDLHGDYSSLQYILMKTWFRERAEDGEPVVLVCMGDYVDRGPGQVEVLYTLTRLLTEHPRNVVLLRGNHEGPSDVGVSPHDFPYVLHRLYDEESEGVYRRFRAFADQLYTAAISPRRALILHGGVPVGSQSLNDVAYAHRAHPDTDTLRQILWNDPMPEPGIAGSVRGVGYLFGPDRARRFLDAAGVQVLIRGHQSCEEGHSVIGDVHTLFSCKLPNYGNRKAAYMELPRAVTEPVENFSNYVKTF
jgi:protein phosphatase